LTKCDGCGKEVGKLYCAKCRAKIKKKTKKELKDVKLIPVLFFDVENNCYRAGCTVHGCPCNHGGVCSTRMLSIEFIKHILHEFDGDNIVQQVCG
jgi:hypothetical protein